MRALLVNPWIFDFAAYDFWLKPLGLLYVGAALKKMGIEVELIDLLNRHDKDLPKFTRVPKDKYYGTGKFPSEIIDKPEVLRKIPRNYKRYGAPEEYLEWKLANLDKPDIVFVTSSMTYWYPGVRATIRTIRNILGNVPIVLGGVYARILPRHAQLKSGADVIFRDSDLAKLGEVVSQLKRKHTEVPFKKWFQELDPAYEMYDRVGYLVFTTSVGCPYKCSYCISPKLWTYERREPVRVVDTIEKYVNIFPVKDIVFFDDAILVESERHFKPLLKELIARQISARFHLPNGVHARLIDEEVAELMKEAGFKTVRLGYETSGSLQIRTGGKVFDADVVRAARILRKSGFTSREVQAYVMINMPGQSVEDIERAMKVCLNEGISVSLNEYTPIKGTLDYTRLIEQNLLTEETDPLLLNNSVLPFWWENGMNAQTVQRIKDTWRKLRNAYLSDTLC